MVLIGEIVIALLAVIGLAVICRKIAEFFLQSDSGREVILVLPFHGRVEDVEYQLRRFACRYQEMAKDVDSGWLICLDKGMDEETRQICEKVCSGYSFMNLCTDAQLEKLI